MNSTNKFLIFALGILAVITIISIMVTNNMDLSGKATATNGTVTVSVSSDVDLVAIDATSNLGTLVVGTINNTDNLTAQRMEFGNNGTSKIQITVQAGTDIWAKNCPMGNASTTGTDNACFNISCEDTLLEKRSGSTATCIARFDATTVNFNITPIASAATFVTDLLGRPDGQGVNKTPGDNFTVGWSLYAPNSESSGAKSVQVVFTASEDTS